MRDGFLAHVRINCAKQSLTKLEVRWTRDDERTKDLVGLSEAEGHGVQGHELAVRLSSLLTHFDERCRYERLESVVVGCAMVSLRRMESKCGRELRLVDVLQRTGANRERFATDAGPPRARRALAVPPSPNSIPYPTSTTATCAYL